MRIGTLQHGSVFQFFIHILKEIHRWHEGMALATETISALSTTLTPSKPKVPVKALASANAIGNASASRANKCSCRKVGESLSGGFRWKVKVMNSEYVAGLASLLLTANADASAEDTGTILGNNTNEVEQIVNRVADFLDKYPFVPFAVAFATIVVIPLLQNFWERSQLRVSAEAAYSALKESRGNACYLIDIRKKKEIQYGGSPEAPGLDKNNILQVAYNGDERALVKELKQRLKEPSKATVYVLDMYDLYAVGVAQSLAEEGYRAFAIKDGFEGKDGWQVMEEKLLLRGSDTVNNTATNIQPPSSVSPVSSAKQEQPMNIPAITSSQSHSPFPSYPDLKPPTSLTPAKPQLQANAFKVDAQNGPAMTGQKSFPISTSGSTHTVQVQQPLAPYCHYPDLKPPTSPMPSKPTSKVKDSSKTFENAKVIFESSRSPYPKYSDLKPPTSPTPSKPASKPPKMEERSDSFTLSPYLKYHELKPPTSPTPSKPASKPPKMEERSDSFTLSPYLKYHELKPPASPTPSRP
eukprot:TRINITY_DN2466_c0_g1_i1.p1 TRINITY_DN2466_c0_g1~~TRINITY_DN2466_c0_g1_i1.p1  ORF type:complete len:525 (+),score=100.89 TRINITY_DN2466_c0_g1_i1:31-1605(+)